MHVIESRTICWSTYCIIRIWDCGFLIAFLEIKVYGCGLCVTRIQHSRWPAIGVQGFGCCLIRCDIVQL